MGKERPLLSSLDNQPGQNLTAKQTKNTAEPSSETGRQLPISFFFQWTSSFGLAMAQPEAMMMGG